MITLLLILKSDYICFFRQIFYAEELGSGFKKIAKWGKTYFGKEPVLQEGSTFRFEAPFDEKMMAIANGSLSQDQLNVGREPVNEPVKLSEDETMVLDIMRSNSSVTKEAIGAKLKKSRATVTRIISSLKEKDLLTREGSDKAGKWLVKESSND